MAVRVLLTGASGFLGRHFLKFFRTKEVEAYTFGRTDCSTHHFRHELDDVDALTAVLDEVQPSFVLHLAGVAASPDISEFYRVNTFYSSCLLQALQASSLRGTPTLMVGTAAEYGYVEPDQLPVKEKAPEKPCTHYGLSKLTQTKMALQHARDLPLVVTRLFNVAGPEMPEYLVFGSFVKQIREIVSGKAEPVLHVGNLNTSRDYLWVTDAVQMMWALLQTPKAYGRIINVCSGRPLEIRTALERLTASVSAQIRIEVDTKRLRPTDMPVHFGDNSLLTELTGLTPSIDVLTELPALLQ